MYDFGWFSTGRDEAARELLAEAVKGTREGTIPARIRFVFCDREPGESPESDRFLEDVGNHGIPLFSFSSRRFEPRLRREDREAWRRAFHEKVGEILKGMEVSTVVLAGYMLIVSPQMCRRFPMINLHPAEPGGPKGTWQEVIWELIARGAERTGVMIHLVTEALDEGPPITYCTFPLKGPEFDRLWVEMGAKLGFMPLGEIIQEEGEMNPLFREIRKHGAMREIPLLLMTMRALAEGRVTVRGGRILDKKGRETGSVCLNSEVEDYLSRRGKQG
ncbi:MAG: formyl transferase [Deltaproteobacteria bacterium]|nr:formyl transferase [Deltaproteobacteria bacterium]